MITTQNIIQLRAFARQDGLLLALLWIASFAAIIYWPETSVGQVLLLATPFLIAWRMRAFRNDALNGVMSYRRAFAYSLHVFFYAALVFALAQYAYFRYLDGGRFVMLLAQGVEEMKEVYSQGQSSPAIEDWLKQTETVPEQIRSTRPIELTFIFMTMNLWIGFFSSFLIAVFGRKNS